MTTKIENKTTLKTSSVKAFKAKVISAFDDAVIKGYEIFRPLSPSIEVLEEWHKVILPEVEKLFPIAGAIKNTSPTLVNIGNGNGRNKRPQVQFNVGKWVDFKGVKINEILIPDDTLDNPLQALANLTQGVAMQHLYLHGRNLAEFRNEKSGIYLKPAGTLFEAIKLKVNYTTKDIGFGHVEATEALKKMLLNSLARKSLFARTEKTLIMRRMPEGKPEGKPKGKTNGKPNGKPKRESTNRTPSPSTYNTYYCKCVKTYIPKNVSQGAFGSGKLVCPDCNQFFKLAAAKKVS